MSALDVWRKMARGLIPRGFLRRDRGEGLFISDYPRYPGAEDVTRALESAGFRVRAGGQLAVLGLPPEQIDAQAAAFFHPDPAPTDQTLFCWGLAQRLIRNGGPVDEEALPDVYLTMKLLDAGDMNRLEKTLPPIAALAQRKHRPLPAAIGALILAHLSEQQEQKEGFVC